MSVTGQMCANTLGDVPEVSIESKTFVPGTEFTPRLGLHKEPPQVTFDPEGPCLIVDIGLETQLRVLLSKIPLRDDGSLVVTHRTTLAPCWGHQESPNGRRLNTHDQASFRQQVVLNIIKWFGAFHDKKSFLCDKIPEVDFLTLAGIEEIFPHILTEQSQALPISRAVLDIWNNKTPQKKHAHHLKPGSADSNDGILVDEVTHMNLIPCMRNDIITINGREFTITTLLDTLEMTKLYASALFYKIAPELLELKLKHPADKPLVKAWYELLKGRGIVFSPEEWGTCLRRDSSEELKKLMQLLLSD